MITLSNRYKLDADKYQYILHDGNKRTFHATPEQACRHIADTIAREEIAALPDAVENQASALLKAIDNKVKHLIRGI